MNALAREPFELGKTVSVIIGKGKANHTICARDSWLVPCRQSDLAMEMLFSTFVAEAEP
jgi:hypothetical protein